jgi:hypothetical protein
MRQSGIRSLALVALAACLSILVSDMALGRLVPIVHRREVQEGMEDFERTDPETLVLASSHARTFHSLGLELEARTQGQRSLVAIPLEFGKLTSYEWLLNHRIIPQLVRQDERATRKRQALKRLIILTEWWDSCTGPDWNIPSRAWTLNDYAADVLVHGLTSYNRNYVQSRWKRLLWGSTLAQDRGADSLYKKARERLSGRQSSPAVLAATTLAWQQMVEEGVTCIGNQAQMAAFDHMIDFGLNFQLDTTIVLFPRKPGTLTEKAKETTLARFREMVTTLSAPKGVRVIDLTWRTPLTDEDFMADFDHVSATGNVKFARWALDGPLTFMMNAPQRLTRKEAFTP